ncbi:MAG: ribbon-helix-helix domain-containing protein [Verrucomicrobiaceae bacterium]|nr:ribbon-helix-helix domain-containing protein [Verrucomicrobiaceae bacterium]
MKFIRLVERGENSPTLSERELLISTPASTPSAGFLSWQGEPVKLNVAMFGLITYSLPMTTLTLDLPEALTAELDAAVEAGWFTSQAEAVRAAVRDMMSHRKLALLEKQQLADIDWAVNAASKRP